VSILDSEIGEKFLKAPPIKSFSGYVNLASFISLFPHILPAIFHEPLEGAAPGVHLLLVEILSFGRVLGPGRSFKAEYVFGICLVEKLVKMEASP